MITNKLFNVAHILKTLVIPDTTYTLEQSGLLYEICIAGDELSTVKIKLLATNEEKPHWEKLTKLITDTLIEQLNFTEVRIKLREFSCLDHCPQQIQELF